MAALRIYLQEGFTGDVVIIKVNGSQVFAGDHVTTNYSAGLAGSVLIEDCPDKTLVEVELPARKKVRSVVIDPSVSPELGVKLDVGEIEFHKADTQQDYY